MSRKLPIVYSALLLTGVNLLLRFVATSFQVYLSALIGPAGIGLLQLILSVSGLALTAGIAGIRTTAMYITAEELGRGHRDHIPWVLTGCFAYCIATSGTLGLLLYYLAPWIAQHWISNMAALSSLRIYSAFLPVICLCGVMTGYFTAANRIGTLAAVEVCEQICTMTVTVIGLMTLPVRDMEYACRAVILGNCCGYVLTLSCLLILYFGHRSKEPRRLPVARRITSTAVPLALADDLKAGISSVENLMVPKRLALFSGIQDPLAVFGMVTGMVFPVLMFPAAILFSLAELLIPELARCAAVDSRPRIRYLIHKNLRITLLYGLFCGCLMHLLADDLCQWLYPGIGVTKYLLRFSWLVPMLYCDLIVDAMTKGLGQQKYCVRYNIVSNALDVILLFILLPRLGIRGYFISFLVTHLLNFGLSLRRLIKIGEIQLNIHFILMALLAAALSLFGASTFTGPVRRISAFCGLFFCISYFFGVMGKTDLLWLKNLLKPQKSLPLS